MPKRHTHPSPSRSSWRRWILASVLIPVVLWLGVQLVRQISSPRPPAVTTAGFEPLIVAQIDAAVAEARASPRSGVAWGRLGMILQAHDLTQEAGNCFAQAERMDPSNARWPYLHGLLLSQQNADAAIARLQRAADLCHEQPDAPQLRLAQSLFEAGRYDDAEVQFRKLLQANAGRAPARLGLAELSHARGRLEETRQLVQPCLTNTHTAKRAHTLLARVERQLGHTNAASAGVIRAAALAPDLPWPDPFSAEGAQYRIGRKAWADQAQQWMDHGRHDAAHPLITRLVKEYPDAPEGWLLLGRLSFERNDCAAAEKSFRRHLELAADSVNGHAQLAMALLCLERYAEAIPVLQRAVQLKADFAEAHFNLGFAQARAGRALDAIESFRNAIRFSPNSVDPYITLADLLSQTGDREEALSLLRRALQLSPSDERAKALWRRVEQR